jgi:hypothetical protein
MWFLFRGAYDHTSIEGKIHVFFFFSVIRPSNFFRYGPGDLCMFFSGYIAHLVDEFVPDVQTREMKEKLVTPGWVETVFFCLQVTLDILRDKPVGWGERTCFGANTTTS